MMCFAMQYPFLLFCSLPIKRGMLHGNFYFILLNKHKQSMIYFLISNYGKKIICINIWDGEKWMLTMNLYCVHVLDMLNINQIVEIFNRVSKVLSSFKNKYVDRISITVGDLQTSSQPLIYQREFSDYSLKIGINTLSQNWRQKKLTASFFSEKNTFRFVYS